MKVFLSWSGELSKQVALALRDWLPNVIQAIEPWMSSVDIDKGAKWSADLASELAATKAGIVCISPDNQNANWLNYEAGALSKSVDNTLVCPYLFRTKPSELKFPLAQFQACEATNEDTRKLILTLNKGLLPKPLTEGKLSEAFNKWWPELESKLETFYPSDLIKAVARTERDMLEELIGTIREQSRMTEQIAHQLRMQHYYNNSPYGLLSAPSGLLGTVAPYNNIPTMSGFLDSSPIYNAAEYAERLVNSSSAPAGGMYIREPKPEGFQHIEAFEDGQTTEDDN